MRSILNADEFYITQKGPYDERHLSIAGTIILCEIASEAFETAGAEVRKVTVRVIDKMFMSFSYPSPNTPFLDSVWVDESKLKFSHRIGNKFTWAEFDLADPNIVQKVSDIIKVRLRKMK